ncbi:MAG: hypothetical protein Q9214_001450 [Letrouitia sp. 1 TL-2023]
MRPPRSGFVDEFHGELPRVPHYPARRPAKGQRRSRQSLLELTAKPVSVDSRPSYPCTAEELRSYRERPPPNRGKPLCPREAVHHLQRFLDPEREPSEKVLAARERFAKALEVKDWDPRLAIKAFKDLDTMFFAGKLMGKTNVCWMGLEEWLQKTPKQPPIEHTVATTDYLGQGTARIMLSSYTIMMITEKPFLQTWITLLHEMVVSLHCPVA